MITLRCNQLAYNHYSILYHHSKCLHSILYHLTKCLQSLTTSTHTGDHNVNDRKNLFYTTDTIFTSKSLEWENRLSPYGWTQFSAHLLYFMCNNKLHDSKKMHQMPEKGQTNTLQNLVSGPICCGIILQFYELLIFSQTSYILIE